MMLNMHFHSKQLFDGRWGIYENHRLLATIACPQECQAIIQGLNRRYQSQLKQISWHDISKTDSNLPYEMTATLASDDTWGLLHTFGERMSE